MASIRRTLSPVPRPGAALNGETCQVASPLSKSSSNSQNCSSHAALLPSSDYALYRVHNFLLGIFSLRSSRPFDRSKLKGQIWWRAFLHFLMCFIVGVLVGLTPLVPLNLSMNVMPKHEAFNFEVVLPASKELLYMGQKNEISVVETSSTLVPEKGNFELKDGTVDPGSGLKNSANVDSNLVPTKLLIIVTPMHPSPLQAFYLNRLAHSLNLVSRNLLWIVVELNSRTVETAEILRSTGVMYRHLVCSTKNSTETIDRNVVMRNVALSHIETHRLDGIVYFADADKIYSTDLFDQMRKISRFGTWMVATLVEFESRVLLEGPVCNSSRVIGWHLVDTSKRSRRFHVEMSGFAFNSTIIWDPRRWHRPTIEPIRQLETVKEYLQASTFIERVVEDETQMECFSTESTGVMVWHHHVNIRSSYPHEWFTTSSFGTIVHIE